METLTEGRAADDTPPYGFGAPGGRTRRRREGWGSGVAAFTVVIALAIGAGWMLSGAGSDMGGKSAGAHPSQGASGDGEQAATFGEPVVLPELAVVASDARTYQLGSPDLYRSTIELKVTAHQDGLTLAAEEYYLLAGGIRVQPTDFGFSTPLLNTAESATVMLRFDYRGNDATLVFAPGGHIVARWVLANSPTNRRIAVARAAAAQAQREQEQAAARIQTAAAANLGLLSPFLDRALTIAASADGTPGGQLTLTRGGAPGSLRWQYAVAVPAQPAAVATSATGQEENQAPAPVAVRTNFAIGGATPPTSLQACLLRPGSTVMFADTLSAEQVAALRVGAHPITTITSTIPATATC